MRRRAAFSLLELLVVLMIVAILAAILLPQLRAARNHARTVSCMANMSRFTLAWVQYATERRGRLVYGAPDNRDDAFVKPGNGDDPIRRGALHPYVPDTEVWHCPDDDSRLDRTFSIIGPMHGEHWQQFRGAQQMQDILNPAWQLVFMEEADRRGFNRGSWQMSVSTAQWFRWIDYVLPIHGVQRNSSNLAFADGHVETWTWKDADTLKAAADRQFYLQDPGNEDWLSLRSVFRQLGPAAGIPGGNELPPPGR